jgi:hypothetical protein
MLVIVPFALSSLWALHAVKLALKQDGVEAQFEHMTKDDSYYKLLETLWEKGESFTVVEHDIIVHPGAIQDLENCAEPWCVFPYYCSVGWITDGLGCTKFSAEFIAQNPLFLSEPFPSCCAHTRYYCGLDRLIAHRGLEQGMKPHVHQPGVVNLNERWT